MTQNQHEDMMFKVPHMTWIDYVLPPFRFMNLLQIFLKQTKETNMETWC
jgi:hypothetical protein